MASTSRFKHLKRNSWKCESVINNKTMIIRDKFKNYNRNLILLSNNKLVLLLFLMSNQTKLLFRMRKQLQMMFRISKLILMQCKNNSPTCSQQLHHVLHILRMRLSEKKRTMSNLDKQKSVRLFINSNSKSERDKCSSRFNRKFRMSIHE